MIRLIYFFLVLFACSSNSQQSVMIIESDKVQELQAKGITVVDIRTPGEFNNGHIAGVVHIDFNDDRFLDKMKALNVDEVVIHCASGGRSKRASEMLQKAGFKIIYDYKGGFNDWKKKGLKIE